MAGRAKGKAECGAVLGTKSCPVCEKINHIEEGRVCLNCGGPLNYWCERKALAGTRCEDHEGRDAHEDAPTTLLAYAAKTVRPELRRVIAALAELDDPSAVLRANALWLLQRVAETGNVDTAKVSVDAAKKWADAKALQRGQHMHVTTSTLDLSRLTDAELATLSALSAKAAGPIAPPPELPPPPSTPPQSR